MGVTWEVEITVTNIKTKAVSVTGVRSDDGLPAETGVTTHTVVGTYDTVKHTQQELLTRFRDALRGKYEHDSGKASQIAAIKAQAESALAAALEVQEV